MWIIALVGSLVVLAVFVLWVPLDIVLEIDVHGRPRITVRFSWFFGLVRHRPAARREKTPKKKKAGGRRFGRQNIGLLARVLGVKGLLKNLLRLVKGTLRSLRPADLAADFRVGLGDPTYTGMLFAFLGPATALLGPAFYERVSLQPAFDQEPIVEGYSRGKARLRPIRLVPHLLRFACSGPTARAAWRLLSARLKRKK